MGSLPSVKGRFSSEGPVHPVYIDPFYLAETEVTVGQWRVFIKETSHEWDKWSLLKEYAPGENYPIVFINWADAEAFCEWRDARLPTRAEWEKAAGGELDEIDYYWGYETPVCQQGTPRGVGIAPRADYIPETHPVGSSTPNEFGLFEMTGGLWEWVSDPYEPGAAAQSPDTVSFMRLFRSGGYGPQYNRYVCSFRCAKSP